MYIIFSFIELVEVKQLHTKQFFCIILPQVNQITKNM